MSGGAVCVIVCVKNASATLGPALESVLAQTVPAPFGPVEIVLIDGGSTDGSLDLASAYAGVRVHSQSGQGLAAARNEAIHDTTAPFIAFCDADDRWCEGALALRLLALSTGAGAVIGRVVREAIAGVAASAGQRALIGQSRPGFTPGAMIVRREVFDRVGAFDETLHIGADSDWFVRLTQSSEQVIMLDDIVLRKGARGASLSGDVVAYRRELLIVARRFIKSRRDANSA